MQAFCRYYVILKAAVNLSNTLLRTEKQDCSKCCKMQNFQDANFSVDKPGCRPS